MPQSKIIKAIGEVGHSKEAPYDKILVSAAATDIPKKLVEELKIGGSMVMPVNSSIFWINKRSQVDIETKEFPGFSFVPLIEN